MSEYTVHDLIDKIDYEGGMSSAIDYGIRIEEYAIPKNLKNDWAEMVEAYQAFAELRDSLEAELEVLANNTPMEDDY